MRNLPHLAQARDDTIAIGVSTPGVYVIERSARAGLRAHRYREQPTEWLALCVSMKLRFTRSTGIGPSSESAVPPGCAVRSVSRGHTSKPLMLSAGAGLVQNFGNSPKH